MATRKKPNTFSLEPTPLDGTEELYTQTGGVNNKFTVQDIWDGVLDTVTINYTGDTIINNQTFNIQADQVQFLGSLPTGLTIQEALVSSVTDNGDGTFTHDDDAIPNTLTTIKPIDFLTGETKTGEQWIDGKDVYRLVVNPPNWTQPSDGDGSQVISSGKLFENVVRLDLYAKYTNFSLTPVLNIGDNSTWMGATYLNYDSINDQTSLFWRNIASRPDFYIGGKEIIIYFILEYTK